MKRVSKEPTLQQQLREMCNCNIDTSPCGAELECRACFNAADLLDECERMLVVGVEVTGDDFAEGIGRWRDEVKATLAKLRGDAQ